MRQISFMDHRGAVVKNRQARGSRHGNARLTEEVVALAKLKMRNGEKPYRVAKHLGISISGVYLIRDGKAWRHVA